MALILGCLVVVCACALVLLGALTGRRALAVVGGLLFSVGLPVVAALGAMGSP